MAKPSVNKFLRKKYGWSVSLLKLINKERLTQVDIPFSKKLSLWNKGFFSSSWFRYGFYAGERYSDYVSDYQENLVAKHINKRENVRLLDDKVIFQETFNDLLPIVKNVGVIRNGKFQKEGAESPSSLLSFLIEKGIQKVFIKPVLGDGGDGIVRVEELGEGYWKWNSEKIDEAQLNKRLASLDDHIVTKSISQSGLANSLFPKTTNTLRVLTMRYPEKNSGFVAHMVIRVGTENSFPVDNLAAGGISFFVDPDSGNIGRGSRAFPVINEKQIFETHPDTGDQIFGKTIPGIVEISKALVNAHNSVDQLNYIGWDVILVEEAPGFIILEANNCPDLKLHQLHGGLLSDPKLKEFYKYHRVIK